MKSCRELKVLTTHEGLPLSDYNVRNLTKILINVTGFFPTFYWTKTITIFPTLYNKHLIAGS